MKKIAIYTIVSENYGNRLQNYAVQKILSERGFDVETLRREKVTLLQKAVKLLEKRDLKRKHQNFQKFDKRIQWSREYIFKDHIPANIDKKYDQFVIGSDQIWNINFYFSSLNDYLPFVDKEKKIALSASFGIDTLPTEYEEDIKKELKCMKAISVREDSGAKIVEKLTGKTCPVLIDPTMMLKDVEWKAVEELPCVDIDQPYILTYFLGENNKEREAWINGIAMKYGMKIYSLLDQEQKTLFSSGPGEFISLFSHADFICTDSYHACVFSILFKKPFTVYVRKGRGEEMNSRISTLLGKFHLENRLSTNLLENDIFRINYEECYKILDKERKMFDQFLKEALE